MIMEIDKIIQKKVVMMTMEEKVMEMEGKSDGGVENYDYGG